MLCLQALLVGTTHDDTGVVDDPGVRVNNDESEAGAAAAQLCQRKMPREVRPLPGLCPNLYLSDALKPLAAQ